MNVRVDEYFDYIAERNIDMSIVIIRNDTNLFRRVSNDDLFNEKCVSLVDELTHISDYQLRNLSFSKVK